MCFQLAASFIISMIVLFGIIYIIIRGAGCDTATAYGLLATVIAAWLPSPITIQQQQNELVPLIQPPEEEEEEADPEQASPVSVESWLLSEDTTSLDDEYDDEEDARR